MISDNYRKEVVLKNVLYGIGDVTLTDQQYLQQRLMEIARINNTDIEGGLLTGLVQYDTEKKEGKNIVGILTADEVPDSFELNFEKEMTLKNVVFLEYKGHPEKMNEQIMVFKKEIENNKSIQATGIVYNLIKKWTVDNEFMDVIVYIEVKPA